MIAEIATASSEQSQGLTQVLSTVSQMDRVTQSNAASTEESAAATQDMKQKVEILHAAVDELRGLFWLAAGEIITQTPHLAPQGIQKKIASAPLAA